MMQWPYRGLSANPGPLKAYTPSCDVDPDRWRRTWRLIAPMLSVAALEALARGLYDDDPRILQGMTCSPPAYSTCGNLPIGAADPLVFGLWQSGACAFVREAEVCLEPILERAGDEYRFLLYHIDDTPRVVLFAELLEEVERSLSERQGEKDGAA